MDFIDVLYADILTIIVTKLGCKGVATNFSDHNMDYDMPTSKLAGAQSIHRASAVLRALSLSQGGLRLAEVMDASTLERPTAHRILQALIREGMVRQHAANRRYYLGPTIFELGLAATPRFDTRAICGPSLDALSEETGDTAFLTCRNGFDSVCLDRREGSYPIRALTVEVGGRRPLGTTAGSLALLAGLSDHEVQTCIAFNAPRIRRYGRLTPKTLDMMVRRSRELGYALNADDITPGVTGIGVSLPHHHAHTELALSVVAVSQRFDEASRGRVVLLLKREVAAIAARFEEV